MMIQLCFRIFLSSKRK